MIFGGIFADEYMDNQSMPQTNTAAPPAVKIAPPPDPLALVNDSFTVPPGVMTTLDVSRNDTLSGSPPYQLLTAPTLAADLFEFHEDGTFQISPLMSQPMLTFTYRVTQGGQTQDATVTITVNRALLYQLTPFSISGQEFVSVPCLVLSGLHYPIYQFNLSNNPADVCTPPHWHRPGGQVFPLEAPSIGTSDPDPPQCGFGIYPAVPQENVIFPLGDWQDFLIDHIPPL